MTVKIEHLSHPANQSIAVMTTDNEGTITVFNQGAEQLLGYKSDEIIGKKKPTMLHQPQELAQLVSQTEASEFEFFQKIAMNKPKEPQKWTYLHKNGNHITIQAHLSAIYNPEQQITGILWMLQLHQNQALSIIGALPQKNVFKDIVTTEIKRMQRNQTSIACLLLSADHFDAYQQHYGQPQTEKCLNHIATLLVGRIKRAGDSIGYYQNNLFALCLPDTHEPGAVKLAETLRLMVATREIPHGASPREAFITLSVGIHCQKATDSLTASNLIDTTLQALEQAQQDGGNCSRIAN